MKKILLIVLAALLVFALVGCKNGDADAGDKAIAETTKDEVAKQEPTEETQKEEEPSEPTTVRFFGYDFANAPLTMDSLAIGELCKKLNIVLDIEMVPKADVGQTLSLAITSSQLADLTQIDTAIMAPYYDTGILVDLTDILPEKMPNVYKQLEDHDMLKVIMTDEGKFYYVPQVVESAKMYQCGWINREWIIGSGLTDADIPTTTDEFYTVLKAFKENMEGIPFTNGPWADFDGPIYWAFGTDSTWRLFDEGYMYAPYEKSEEFKSALAFLNKLYSEELMDIEYLTRSTDDIRAMSVNNQIGYYHTWTDHAQAIVKGGTEGRDYVSVPALNAQNGGRENQFSPVGYEFGVSGESEVAEKIYEMLDYIYSDEGIELFAWGIEGTTFETVDGQKQFTDAVLQHEKGALTGRRMFGIQPNNFPHVSLWEGWKGVLLSESVQVTEANEPYLYPAPITLTGTLEEEDEFTQIMADVQKYVDEQIPLFISGELDTEGDFDAFMADLKAMNVERAIEIKGAQYERYLAR